MPTSSNSGDNTGLNFGPESWYDNPTTVNVLKDILGGVGAAASSYETPWRRRRIFAPVGGLLAGGADILGDIGQGREQRRQAQAMFASYPGLVTPEEQKHLMQRPELVPEFMKDRQAYAATQTAQQQWQAEQEEKKRADELANRKLDLYARGLGLREHGGSMAMRDQLMADGVDPATATPAQRQKAQDEIDARKASVAGAQATARGNAAVQVLNARPFSMVIHDVVPFRMVPEVKDPKTGAVIQPAHEQAISGGTYGSITNDPSVFYIPKALVQDGKYARLLSLPGQGADLARSMQRLMPGVGTGVSGYVHGKIADWKADPRYSDFQSRLATYTDTVASSLSGRVSQTLIDQWRHSIAPKNATPASVQWAIRSMTQEIKRYHDSLREEGQGGLNNEYGTAMSTESGYPTPAEMGGDSGDSSADSADSSEPLPGDSGSW